MTLTIHRWTIATQATQSLIFESVQITETNIFDVARWLATHTGEHALHITLHRNTFHFGYGPIMADGHHCHEIAVAPGTWITIDQYGTPNAGIEPPARATVEHQWKGNEGDVP